MNGLTLKLFLPAAMLSLIAAAAFADPAAPESAAPTAAVSPPGVLPDAPPTAAAGAPAPNADGLAPAPAAPATRPAAQVQAWFDQLAAAESAAREQARVELMGIGREDLDTLREVVQKNGPPAAQQAAVLHDIVVHVYLAGDDYDPARPGAGFLGVHLGMDRGGGIALPEDSAVNVGEADSGVPIAEAMPGFCGFRYLRSGDVVLGVDAPQWTRTPTAADLIQIVSQTPPGRKITLHVLRQGRVIEVPLVLSPRPRVAEDQLATKLFIDDRQSRAEEYWQSKFAPLLGRSMS